MLYIENMTKESYIIGIDPGLVNTGWGIIKTNGNHIQFVSCGTISPNTKDNMAKRYNTYTVKLIMYVNSISIKIVLLILA